MATHHSSWVFIFVSTYVVYHLTLLPSTPGGDSGELLAEACLLGIPHPPGYPLFTLLSHVASQIPFPRFYLAMSNSTTNFPTIEMTIETTKAWRVNHLCSILGAATAVLIALSTDILFTALANSREGEINSSPVSGVGALLFALSPLVWEYSLSAEVFALNNLLCALVIFQTCKAFTVKEEDKSSWIRSGALSCGLALSNQHASLLSILPLIAAVLWACYPTLKAQRKLLSTILLSTLLFLLAFSSYLYLYYAALHPKPGSWGDLRTPIGMLRHVLRAEYGTFQLGVTREGTEDAMTRLRMYLEHVQKESGNSILPLAAAGAFGGWWLRRTGGGDAQGRTNLLPLALLASWIFYTIVWHCVLSNLPLSKPMPFGVHARFWMQPNLFLCVAAGAGSRTVFAFIVRLLEGAGMKNKSAEPLFVVLLEWSLLVGLLAALLSSRFAIQDRSRSGWIMHQYASAALDSLPPQSLLLAHTDLDWNSMRYLRECEGVRPDITHLSLQMLPYPWFRNVQAPLPIYQNVTFPDLSFPGVSTNRASEGNAQLVGKMLMANGLGSHTLATLEAEGKKKKGKKLPTKTAFPGGLYLDMQSINDADLGDGHTWRGLMLCPWGSLYRVFAPMSLEDSAALHPHSMRQLRALEARMPALDAEIALQFPPGTWEHAAFSVTNDARLQLAMALLTFSIAHQPALKPERILVLLLLVDRLRAASLLFSEVLEAAGASGNNSRYSILEVSKRAETYGALSSPLFDARKNGALAWMRLEQMFALAVQFRQALVGALETARTEQVARPGMLLNPAIMDDITENELANVRYSASVVIRAFLNLHPGDKDFAIFNSAVDKMEMALGGERFM